MFYVLELSGVYFYKTNVDYHSCTTDNMDKCVCIFFEQVSEIDS